MVEFADMSFNSLEFFIFFPTVVALFFLIPSRFQWVFLLLASCVFYMAFIPQYLFVLFATITVDYVAALFIEKAQGKLRTFYLGISIFFTCLILFLFKYYNFFNANLIYLAEKMHWNYQPWLLKLILPIGLSFHTFQSLSYVFEVYRGGQVERHFGIYSLYVMFFPQLVAGPIERPYHLIHQFHEKKEFDSVRVVSGLRLMLWGFFKKIVIADQATLFVNTVFNHPAQYQGISLVVTTFFFSVQIYCDFSGYSDIAIGAAQILGFDLMKNFNRPYFSKSVVEFWRRWHISLTTWFRDYLYIPLGGNRVPMLRQYVNLLVVFLISGLWHGAQWTFVIWGFVHSVFYIATLTAQKIFGTIRIPTGLKIGSTFILTSAAWVLFRANNISDAQMIYEHLGTGWKDFFSNLFGHIHQLGSGNRILGDLFLDQPVSTFLCLIAAILVLVFIEICEERSLTILNGPKSNARFRWAVYYGLTFWILLTVTPASQFIYFQF